LCTCQTFRWCHLARQKNGIQAINSLSVYAAPVKFRRCFEAFVDFNLDSAVGRARVGRTGVGWQGAATQLAPASKEAQRRQHAPERLNRVRSADTQLVNDAMVKKVN